MKHLTIISGETEPHLTKEFIHYLNREPHRFQINEVTYRTKPQFKPGDVVVAERVFPAHKVEGAETRFVAEEIKPLYQNGVYVFLLSEFMTDFGMADFGINNKTGLTGIIFKNHAPYAGGRFQFRGYNGIFTRAADFMLGSYLARS